MLKFSMTVIHYICVIRVVPAARILLLHPILSKSHANFNDAIATSLLDAGHHVTAFTFFPNTILHRNYTGIDPKSPHLPKNVNFLPLDLGLQLSNSLTLMNLMRNSTEHRCYHTIQHTDMQRIIKSKDKFYDLLMIDTMAYSFDCFLPIAEIMNIPVIGTIPMRSWRYSEWIMGNPYNPAVTPFDLSHHSSRMSFVERLRNTWHCIFDFVYYNHIIHPRIENLYGKYFPNSTVARRKKPSLLLTNGHSVLNPRPMLPTIINIGGIHMSPVKPLPKNLQEFIDSAEHGVILFSFGSLMQSHKMPFRILSIFREVFSQLPQRVIWKAEGEIEFLSENILLSSWIPQRDILAHKNVIAFITHAGLAGLYEAFYGGTPMVLVPTFFDQMSNAAILQQLGVGIHLDMLTLTKEKLVNALNDIVNGTYYRQQTAEISNRIKDQPLSPQEVVIYWTEYVLRHNGTEHLESVASKILLYQYLLSDVIGLVFVIVVLSFGLCYLLQNLRKYCRRNVLQSRPICLKKN